MVNSLKKNGVIYTPIELGKYMARKMFCAYNSTFSEDMTYSILDPSCGTGDLLEAAVLVAKELGIRVRVIGFDVDEIALEKAKERFKVLKIESDFFFDDFLKFSLDKKFDGPLFNDESHTYDFIISNPPYIRTQHLGEEYSKQLSKNFGLTGKIDIYQAFYAAFPSFMHSETVMSVITSNKFISNKTGKSLRNLLHKTFMIEEIIDLGDTKVFDAAVLPAIVIGKLCSDTQTNAPFYSVYETNAVVNVEEYKVNSFLNIIGNEPEGNFFVANQYYTGTKGIISFPKDHGEPWVLSSRKDLDWAKNVDRIFGNKIKDHGKVRVGIKTTADNVFINPSFDNFQIEEDLLHPLFSSRNASKWTLGCNINELPKILYPMLPGNGKRKAVPIELSEYPKAKEYLESYFEQLDGRKYVKKAKRKWFEIWVPQDPKLWERPKIIWPDISSQSNFILDQSGLYVDGNCYWLVVDDNNLDLLLLILGVCNSSILKRYHEIKFQNKLYSNKYRYISQYIEEYPIPDISFEESKQIIDIVKDIIDNGPNKEKEEKIDDLLMKIIDI